MAGQATMLGIFLIVAVLVLITVGRILAGVIRDINRYDQGLVSMKRRKR